MKDRDRATLAHYYNENLRRYGYDSRSLGWIQGTQLDRFSVLTAVGNLEGCSILDVGCGFGDLYEFLRQNGINVDYTGVDLNQDFIEIARQRHPDAEFIVDDFESSKIKGKFDWSFESGIFNLKVSDHDAFVRNMLRKMFKVSRKGIAADFLNDRGLKTGEMYHPSPVDLYNFCNRMSGRVVLRCDYKPTEFCVYVYKDDKPVGCTYPGYKDSPGDLR